MGRSAEKLKEAQKLAFVDRALDCDDPFHRESSVCVDNLAAVEWQAARCPRKAKVYREMVTKSVEERGASLQASGAVDRWFDECDPKVRMVSRGVNGPLLQELAATVRHCDAAVVLLFKLGAKLFGSLPLSGVGEELAQELPVEPDTLLGQCGEHNAKLLKSIRSDALEKQILQCTLEDASKGRMSDPVPFGSIDTESVRVHPRFGVEQGVKPDGSVKVRPVDHFSWSATTQSRNKRKRDSVNGHTQVQEKMHHDHLDDLCPAIAVFIEKCGCAPGLFKVDVDSAFRRIPLLPAHRWASAVAFMVDSAVMVSFHNAMPFGAVASVHAWERVGALLITIIRRLLFIPMFRYVDDLFAFDFEEALEHSTMCAVRLIRACLGSDSIADRKVDYGSSLCILGVELSLSKTAYRCRLSREKAAKWIAIMRRALHEGIMYSGDAQKMAGRLSWSTQFLFYRVGRAMIRPIFDQKRSKDGAIHGPLRVALQWWIRILQMEICEEHYWGAPLTSVAHMWVDARGVPSRLAAVLFIDGEWFYTDGAPSDGVMSRFKARRDRQITSTEMLSISLGLATFAWELFDRKVIVYSDNKGAEACMAIVAVGLRVFGPAVCCQAATRKGSAREWDHCEVIHEVWTQACCCAAVC